MPRFVVLTCCQIVFYVDERSCVSGVGVCEAVEGDLAGVRASAVCAASAYSVPVCDGNVDRSEVPGIVRGIAC